MQENVRAFYERLAMDEAFRTQIQVAKSKDEFSEIIKNTGYDFTQEEFEEFTAKLLPPTDTEGTLRDLNEKELESVFGGIAASTFIPVWTLMGATVKNGATIK